jgi:hypothetical protein
LRIDATMSDREIGRACGLSQPTVKKIRDDLELTAQIEQTDIRVGKGGRTYEVHHSTGRATSEQNAARSLSKMLQAIGGAFDACWWDTAAHVADLITALYPKTDLAEIAGALESYSSDLTELVEELRKRVTKA